MYDKDTIKLLHKQYLTQNNPDLSFKDWLLINELHSSRHSIGEQLGFITDELEEISKAITSLKGV